ncbi:unnamed protein product [Ectocarpus sp. 12 AP-2014]
MPFRVSRVVGPRRVSSPSARNSIHHECETMRFSPLHGLAAFLHVAFSYKNTTNPTLPQKRVRDRVAMKFHMLHILLLCLLEQFHYS